MVDMSRFDAKNHTSCSGEPVTGNKLLLSMHFQPRIGGTAGTGFVKQVGRESSKVTGMLE